MPVQHHWLAEVGGDKGIFPRESTLNVMASKHR